MGPAAVNGSCVGGCLRGVRLSPPRVISAWWPRPRRHQRVADVICSHSAMTWRNGNQCRQREGRVRDRKRVSDLVSPYIYLPDTVNSARPAEKKTTLPLSPPPYSHGFPDASSHGGKRGSIEEHLANWLKWYIKTYAYLIAGIASAFS